MKYFGQTLFLTLTEQYSFLIPSKFGSMAPLYLCSRLTATQKKNIV